MFKDTRAFSGFSVNDLAAAKKFYDETLGITTEDGMGLTLKLAGGNDIFIYEKKTHEPATYTILNFVVDDIDASAKRLSELGIELLQYDLGNGAKTGEDGIMRGRAANMGPDIAWFKDPAGNILSILQN